MGKEKGRVKEGKKTREKEREKEGKGNREGNYEDSEGTLMRSKVYRYTRLHCMGPYYNTFYDSFLKFGVLIVTNNNQGKSVIYSPFLMFFAKAKLQPPRVRPRPATS